MKKNKTLLAICLVSFGLLFMSSCGDSKSACSHSYSAWTITKAATCEQKGEKSRSCTKCGDVQELTIAAKGHNYSNGICTVCGKKE